MMKDFFKTYKWIKGSFVTTEGGHLCDIYSPLARCFCLTGGIKRIYGPQASRIYPNVAKVIQDLFPNRVVCVGEFGLFAFNDHHLTTIEDVEKVIECANL